MFDSLRKRGLVLKSGGALTSAARLADHVDDDRCGARVPDNKDTPVRGFREARCKVVRRWSESVLAGYELG